MAKLTKVPEFLLEMSKDEDALYYWTLEDVLNEDGSVKTPGIITKAVEWGVIDDLEALLEEKSTKKRYPRVLKPSKKPELKGKLTWQADKTQQPHYELSPVGFFEVKAQFIHDICGLPRVDKPEEPDFRAKIKAAAAAARAAKEAAASSSADAIDEKLGFKK